MGPKSVHDSYQLPRIFGMALITLRRDVGNGSRDRDREYRIRLLRARVAERFRATAGDRRPQAPAPSRHDILVSAAVHGEARRIGGRREIAVPAAAAAVADEDGRTVIVEQILAVVPRVVRIGADGLVPD